jgi:hypothetical protein
MKKEADERKCAEIARREAIPERIRLSEKWQDMNKILLSFVTTDGELGTITNLEMHNIRKNGNLTGNDGYLKSVLKSGLPEKANITDKYSGNTRIIVTAAQSILQNGDDFYLRIRVLSESEQLSGKLYYRLMGTKLYSSANLKLMSAHVFEVSVPAVKISDDFEYYIEVSDGKGKVIYPVTAGVLNNAVVIL